MIDSQTIPEVRPPDLNHNLFIFFSGVQWWGIDIAVLSPLEATTAAKFAVHFYENMKTVTMTENN